MVEDWKNTRKGENTRKRILQAARMVFSNHPYHSASVRMVGKAGNFDHPIIHYYFPKKAGLFEAVVNELLEEINAFATTWYKDLDTMSTGKSFSLCIDRLFEFHRKSPDLFRLIMQNTAHVEDYSSFPAVDKYTAFHDGFLNTFQEKITYTAPPEDVRRFVYSFTVVVTNYLGASSTYAQFLGLDPASREYLEWVKETLMFIFLPRLKKIIFYDQQDAKA
ncbi:MAG: TetR/AcrR family transcriptional regulator [Proteobacteria bacterium]|nr:TetR/AcrR family transcriptional regulator [Pseudomonadota bacterium]